MATAPHNVSWNINIEKGNNAYGATAPKNVVASINIESPRTSNNNVSIPVGFTNNKTRAQRRRNRKQRRQRKTRKSRRANRR